MSRPVERWLGTFMCTQYADTFEAHGYKTLQSVCQLDFHQLQSMGVRPEHCEKIMENVSVLRQSYTGGGAAIAVGPKEALPKNPGTGHGGCGFNMNDRRPPSANYAASQMGMGPPQRITEYPVACQMFPAHRYPYNPNQVYGDPQYNNYVGNQMDTQMGMDSNQTWPNSGQGSYGDQRQQSGKYNMNTGQYQSNQQHCTRQNRIYSGNGSGMQGITDIGQNCSMQQPTNNQCGDGMASSPASGIQAGSNDRPSRQGSGNGMQSSVATSACGGQMTVSESQQHVADSILQMASSTYQGTASHKMTVGTQHFRCGYAVGSMPSPQQTFSVSQPTGQYCYPSNQSVGSPLSPIQVRSPASAQNSQCMTSASPSPIRSPVGSVSEHCPIPSPAMTGMQSPVSNMRQPMCSPIQGNLPMSTCSPVPHMNIARHPSLSPGLGHQSVLPPSSPMSQMNPHSHTSPSPLMQMKSSGHHPSLVLSPGVNYSPDSIIQHSREHLYRDDCYPSASIQSEYVGYTSVSSPSHYIELQPACRSSTSTAALYGSQYSTSKCTDGFSPLQSLQKLVMLPESQVVDPKSVVSDANMLSPEGSKYDEGSGLLSDGQLASTSDHKFLSNSEQVCSDGKHCGSDVEDKLDLKHLAMESNTSKDEKTKDINGMKKKCRTRKKLSKKTADNLEVVAVKSELEHPVKQKFLRRGGQKQLNESFVESPEIQQHTPPAKCSTSSQVTSDVRRVSDPKTTTDLVHFSETSIRHCTVELEDISPLKNGRTHLNGFGDYTFFNVKHLGCKKLDDCREKQSRNHIGSVSQSDITVLDAEDLKPSVGAKRIRKHNQSLNVNACAPAAQLSSSLVKQNGIHKGVARSGCVLSMDRNGDQSEDSKGSNKPKNCIKSLFNGKCTEELGDLKLNASSRDIISPLRKDLALKNHLAAGQLTPMEGGSPGCEITLNSSIHENNVSKLQAASKQQSASLCDEVKVTSDVDHRQSSVAASLSLHDDSLDSSISKSDMCVSNQDPQKVLTLERCYQLKHQTEQVSSHEEIHQNACTDNVATENTLQYAQIAFTIPRKSEQYDNKEENVDQLKSKTQCNGMFSGQNVNLKSSEAGNTHSKMLEKDMENSPSEVGKANLDLDLEAVELADESKIKNKCGIVDCGGIASSTLIKDVSETHLCDTNSQKLHCWNQLRKQTSSGHGKRRTELDDADFLDDKIEIHLKVVAMETFSDKIIDSNSSSSVTEKTLHECVNSNICAPEESEEKVNMMETTEKLLTVVKQVHTEEDASGTEMNSFKSDMCNGMNPTNSHSPTKASDKENPSELGTCKVRRRCPFTLAPKCLDYSSDETAEVEEAIVSKYNRPVGSRSPKLSCVENKKRHESFIPLRLNVIGGVEESTSVVSVKNHCSIIECNSRHSVLKEKSSLDLIVNRLNQHVVEKQVLTVAPVYVLSSHNKAESTVEKASSTNTCNHTSNRRMLRNSSAKTFYSECSNLNDSGISKKVISHSASDEVQEGGNDRCSICIPCSAESSVGVLSDAVSESTSLQFGDDVKTEPAVQVSMIDFHKDKAGGDHYHSEVKPDVMNNFEVRESKTNSQPSSLLNKTKNGSSHGSNGLRIRSKARRTKKRYGRFSELGSEDEKLRKLFKIKPEKKGKNDHMKSKQYSHLPKGPYIKITGNRDLPESFVVVNLCHGDTDKHKLLKGYSKPECHLDPGSEALMKMSSSSPWVCVFCGRGSNEDGTGDLFGPYFFQLHSSLPSPANSSDSLTPTSELTGDILCSTKSRVKKKACVLENKSGKGKCHSGSASGRKITMSSPAAKRCKRLNNPSSREIELRTEVWMHEDCVVWTSGVFAMGGKIHGLEEALHVAKYSFCSVCKNSGATLGCFQKACNQKYHYICALNTDCYMDEENFSLLCQRHKDKRLRLSGPENS